MVELPLPLRQAMPAGVSRTAVYMSLIRDRESRRPDALFHDPFSEAVVAALTGTPEMGEVAAGLGATADSVSGLLDAPAFGYFSVRTRYFDDRLVTAMRSGIRQVVSLAAGLDGRPMRLACPPGTRWYELDLPPMVEFKEWLAKASRITPTCDRRGVAADLASGDWLTGLQEAGFDRGQPTIWLIEGLLMYLSDEASSHLLTRLTQVSACRSELLAEHASTRMLAERGGTIQEAIRAQDSVLASARDDLADWLASYGWQAVVHAGSDPAIGYGRVIPEMPAGWLAAAVLAASAERAGRQAAGPVGCARPGRG